MDWFSLFWILLIYWATGCLLGMRLLMRSSWKFERLFHTFYNESFNLFFLDSPNSVPDEDLRLGFSYILLASLRLLQYVYTELHLIFTDWLIVGYGIFLYSAVQEYCLIVRDKDSTLHEVEYKCTSCIP
jgi:hypothetical protein